VEGGKSLKGQKEGKERSSGGGGGVIESIESDQKINRGKKFVKKSRKKSYSYRRDSEVYQEEEADIRALSGWAKGEEHYASSSGRNKGGRAFQIKEKKRGTKEEEGGGRDQSDKKTRSFIPPPFLRGEEGKRRPKGGKETHF